MLNGSHIIVFKSFVIRLYKVYVWFNCKYKLKKFANVSDLDRNGVIEY